ncbi:unnamed protein product [Mytilus edulis]|uniref:Core-binding (CB) domain-containing protein n=1 Tax=Mytilus edulis TaxID=6550 RepID=A0A8S3PTP5_MYTED|nr:unnamed protein product [Mytilus edulis]
MPELGVPLAEDKTVLPVEILTFLGIEFDTIAMELRLPKVKLIEIKQRITVILGCKKVKLRELQSLIGLLNFACQVVVPGRAFCRRLIDATCNVKEAWHRIRVSSEMKDDLQIWLSFLNEYNGVSVMLDLLWTSNETIQLYTDSAGGSNRGFGIYFDGKWSQACWPREWSQNALQTVSTTSRQGTYSNAKPTMEILDVEVKKLVHFSMAKNTWKTYKTALESLAKFSKEYDLNVSWPIQIDVLTRFIAYLSYSGLTSSTINTYLSGISH